MVRLPWILFLVLAGVIKRGISLDSRFSMLLAQEQQATEELVTLYFRKRKLLQRLQELNFPTPVHGLVDYPKFVHDARLEQTKVPDIVVPMHQHEFKDPSIVGLKFLSMSLRPSGATGKRSRRSQQQVEVFNVLVLLRENGMVEIMDLISRTVYCQYRVRVASDANIEQLAILEGEEPYIAVRQSNGKIQVLRVRMWKSRRLVVGTTYRPNMVTASKAIKLLQCPVGQVEAPWYLYEYYWRRKYVPPVHGMHIQLSTDAVIDSKQASCASCHFRLHMLHRRLFAIEAYKSGDLNIYNVFDRERSHHLKVPHPIYAVLPLTGSILAYTAGRHVGLLNLNGMLVFPKMKQCKGLMSNITNLAADALRQSYFYASTEDGKVLVFNSFGRQYGSREISGSCELQHQMLTTKHHDISKRTFVTTLKGIALIKNAVNHLMAYNVTNMMHRNVAYINEDITPRSSSQDVQTLDFTSTKMLSTNGLIIHIYASTSASQASRTIHVDVSECLIHHSTSFFDIAWIRGPIMILGIVGVIGYQAIQKAKSRVANEDGPQFDFHKFAKEFNKWDISRGGQGIPESAMR